MDFDFQPYIIGETLVVRPLKADDFDGLYLAASDPLVWAGHPAKDRYEKEVFRPYFDMLLATEATVVVLEKSTGKVIGCSRYYEAPTSDQDISIGYTFLERACWGGTVNAELKSLMMGHVFKFRPEVWFHIDPTNTRSQKATAKLGAVNMGEEELDLGTGAARWMCFRLTSSDWEKKETT
ncbi:GNAT family N-acetyltransferase [Parasedimentitalea maritima]|uniref:GNAT family N-acetyltransferase n=1 Tax=Parasedimentitalea maritima TaxID=2578117 RepID=A0A6A4REX5_9RHOB|nr:GNAT family N-acetyltransferase [Zongyanglinia marina]KAE9627887.1 GNAT family N-acetyltransferase [Zongyanglinia marina]